MAQVSVPLSPAAMSRRPPLTNLPNAVNSPYQITTTCKRSRSQSNANRDPAGQPPPKKQVTESVSVLRTPVRKSACVADSRLPPPKKTAVRTRPPAIGPPTFADIGQQRKLQQKTTATDAQQQDNLETIRKWQKHYRQAFPSYVFFFESIPNDVISKEQRQISTLGANHEKFFSSKVTHVITNRTAPPEDVTHKAVSRIKGYVDPDSRKFIRGGNDILLKAREYGMKIWGLDKLQRVLNGLLDVPIPNPSLPTISDRNGRNTQTPDQRAQKNVDLSHLLRNERLHGPTDRDPHANPRELHHFKGPFIYVHDRNNVTRPIIVREYPKVQHREDGTWPQFRSVSGGKCPFIEEPEHQRREKYRPREKVKAREERNVIIKGQTKNQKTNEISNLKAPEIERRPPRKELTKYAALFTQNSRTHLTKSKRPLADISDIDGRENSHMVNKLGTYKCSQNQSISITANHMAFEQENGIAFTATGNVEANQYVQEPAASGLQPSNITSAIRSQVISSHPDQPGQRAGTTKEIYGLQRKIAGNVMLANPQAGVNGISTKQSNAYTASLGKKRGYDGKEKALTGDKSKSAALKVERPSELVLDNKNQTKPESRPGYCENCREKFDDFEEHTLSRKHRKFATDPKNWGDLDRLLNKLRRPINKGIHHL